ncbi:MAG: energy-coupling factor ABC transporter ATP-binding protein [Promethearchaeota archaeon]
MLIDDVDFTYPNGTKALRNINLKIYKNEIIGILGKNGAGKTTLIRTLNGLIRPKKGSIYLHGETIELKSIATLSKKVGIIFQNPSHQLFANSVEDEIKFSLRSFELTKEEIQNKINAILEEYNLEKYRNRSPLNLSGGESKKLAVASIICRDPEILVFDEPTLGQDGREIDFFINLIKNERKKGKTIIIITHNIEFANEYIPRTVLMADGCILADGPTEKVLSNQLLVEKASLILPQTRQFNLSLNKSGIQCPNDLFTKEKLIHFIKGFIRSKTSEIMEGND